MPYKCKWSINYANTIWYMYMYGKSSICLCWLALVSAFVSLVNIAKCKHKRKCSKLSMSSLLSWKDCTKCPCIHSNPWACITICIGHVNQVPCLKFETVTLIMFGGSHKHDLFQIIMRQSICNIIVAMFTVEH